MKKSLLLCIAVVVNAAGIGGIFPLGVRAQVDAPPVSYATDHVIVRMKGSEQALTVRAPGMTVDEAVSRLKETGAVDVAEPDYTYHLAALPNDPNFSKQWYLQAAHLPEAWEIAKGSPTVTVAVLDSGVDLTHPDLKDRIWANPDEVAGNGIDDDHNGLVDDVHGWDFIDGDNDPSPVVNANGSFEGINHGTLVAGAIGAATDNATGIAGVDWNVRLMPLRVLDSQGNGSTSEVDAAIRYAVRKGAKIINISFSGHGYSQILADTIRDATRAGVIIVAAAGNEGDTARGGNLDIYPEYPACYRGANDEPSVIGVSALDARGVRSSFTNYGAKCISLSAPGENFFLTQVYRPGVAGFEEPYGAGWSGSSLAAPMVTGAVALMASMSPGITPADVRRFLTANAADISVQNPGFSAALGAGELDVAASIKALQTALLTTGPSALTSTVPASFLIGSQAGSDLVAAAPGFGDARAVLLKGDLSAFTGFGVFARRVTEPPSLALADLDGTGNPSLVVGAPKGELPYVRIFNRDGALITQFLAFAATFRGGVNVARIDIDGSGHDAIAVAPASGGAPTVKIFKADGTLRGDFPVGDSRLRTGLRLTAVDTDLDGIDEIVVAPADASGHTARVYGTDGKQRFFFDPFGRVAWRGGFNLASGDLNGDGRDELVVGAGAGGPPSVAVFARDGRPLVTWTAFAPGFRGGVAVAVSRFGGSGHVLAGQATTGNELRVYTQEGTLERRSQPFGPASFGGVRPAGFGLSSRKN